MAKPKPFGDGRFSKSKMRKILRDALNKFRVCCKQVDPNFEVATLTTHIQNTKADHVFARRCWKRVKVENGIAAKTLGIVITNPISNGISRWRFCCPELFKTIDGLVVFHHPAYKPGAFAVVRSFPGKEAFIRIAYPNGLIPTENKDWYCGLPWQLENDNIKHWWADTPLVLRKFNTASKRVQ